MNQTDPDKEN